LSVKASPAKKKTPRIGVSLVGVRVLTQRFENARVGKMAELDTRAKRQNLG
jgi:hypothetical protein